MDYEHFGIAAVAALAALPAGAAERLGAEIAALAVFLHLTELRGRTVMTAAGADANIRTFPEVLAVCDSSDIRHPRAAC